MDCPVPMRRPSGAQKQNAFWTGAVCQDRKSYGTGRYEGMTGLGTIVNIGAIMAGCLVGMLLKGGLPKRLQDTIAQWGCAWCLWG